MNIKYRMMIVEGQLILPKNFLNQHSSFLVRYCALKVEQYYKSTRKKIFGVNLNPYLSLSST